MMESFLVSDNLDSKKLIGLVVIALESLAKATFTKKI